MPTPVVMPKLGNSVENCILVGWKKQPGDTVQTGDVLCEVETDKAVVEVESQESGTLLAHFFAVGDDVPVMTNIAAIGEPGEDFASLRPGNASDANTASTPATQSDHPSPPTTASSSAPRTEQIISPRARNLAARKAVAVESITGSGPGGRIIERDVEAALAEQSRLTPVAQAMLEQGDYDVPARGSGPGGRIMSHDLTAADSQGQSPTPAQSDEDVEIERIPVEGVRRVIADRMQHSLQNTAQLTLHVSGDARALLRYRKRLKASDETLGLRGVTINDLLLFAVARTLPHHPQLNALYENEIISRYKAVHLGFAVDTPRGLMVPVIPRANQLSLQALAQESNRLAQACLDGKATPDELTGSTFTVTNLGHLGVEQFTPILNPPQVGILGIGNINLKPVYTSAIQSTTNADDGTTPVIDTGISETENISFVPHIGLSLTIDHQVVDGVPGARFLQALASGIARFDLLLAL